MVSKYYGQLGLFLRKVRHGLAHTGTPPSKLAQGRLLSLRLFADSRDTLLTGDITIKTGSVLFLDGAGMTIRTAQNQFIVEAGAKLCLYNINLIDGKVSFCVKQLDCQATNSC